MTIITIDGPSGAGKSTIAKMLSKKLNYNYLDTGAMYRAITFAMLKKSIDLQNEELICKALDSIDLEFSDNIKLDGDIIDSQIRSNLVTKNVSLISSYKCVRDILVEYQRCFAKGNDTILDGRDTGSVVLPDADFKFYLTASVEARAKRRYEEYKEEREDSYNDVLEDIKRRDDFDMNRDISPLIIPNNSILVDSTDMSIDETVEYIYNHIKRKDK
ncbi:MAG: (d)CMP kinase [Tissierellia bacterium]|nr:(d)CMP kinase [Tissierellia bacterium]